MLDRIREPQALYTEISRQLSLAKEDRRHPFYLFALASENDARMIVLRDFDSKSATLTFYTDIRSHKVGSITPENILTCLFYDPAEKTQLRMRIQPTLHHQDDVTSELWNTVPENNRMNYASPFAPGTPISEPASAEGIDLSQAQSHFAVVRGTIESIDILQIGRERHLRAILRKSAWLWNLEWLTP